MIDRVLCGGTGRDLTGFKIEGVIMQKFQYRKLVLGLLAVTAGTTACTNSGVTAKGNLPVADQKALEATEDTSPIVLAVTPLSEFTPVAVIPTSPVSDLQAAGITFGREYLVAALDLPAQPIIPASGYVMDIRSAFQTAVGSPAKVNELLASVGSSQSQANRVVDVTILGKSIGFQAPLHKLRSTAGAFLNTLVYIPGKAVRFAQVGVSIGNVTANHTTNDNLILTGTVVGQLKTAVVKLPMIGATSEYVVPRMGTATLQNTRILTTTDAAGINSAYPGFGAAAGHLDIHYKTTQNVIIQKKFVNLTTGVFVTYYTAGTTVPVDTIDLGTK